eukprot:3267019-Lingulodinium_polyedra.AAC.1
MYTASAAPALGKGAALHGIVPDVEHLAAQLGRPVQPSQAGPPRPNGIGRGRARRASGAGGPPQAERGRPARRPRA